MVMKLIDLARFDNKSFIGEIIRFPLRLIPKSLTIKVLQGSNKGYKWVVGSGVHGYWFGSYEHYKQKAISSYTREGMVAYDIGAHAGFYTLLFSGICGASGYVYSFEPNPDNLIYLNRHLELNKIDNAEILRIALSNTKSYMFFDDTQNSSMGHLSENETGLKVPTDTIDNLMCEGLLKPPDIMKIDVEGAELDVLFGGEETISTYKPIIFIAIDNPDNEGAILDFLRKRDYKIEKLNDNRYEIVAYVNR